MDLARNIEKIEFYNNREKQHNSWVKQAAEALELDLDEDLLLGRWRVVSASRFLTTDNQGRVVFPGTARTEDADRGQQKMVKKMKKHLKHLISQPVFKNTMKTKYPTQLGKLPAPRLPAAGMESAISSVATVKEAQEKAKSVRPQGKRPKKKTQAAEIK